MSSESVTPVRSYWVDTAGSEPEGAPVSGDRTVDVAVIGGGYTGLAAAYRLAGSHGRETAVLEAASVGWGASGRNGGFAMIGMGKIALADRIRLWGLEAARRTVARSVEAVETVRDLIARESIDCDAQPPGWINVAHRPAMVAALHDKRDLFIRLGYTDVEFLDRPALAERGYLDSAEGFAALRLGAAFGLHPLEYVRGLARAAARRGAVVCERSPVVGWTRDGGWHHLATPGGTVRARRVVLATNGYTPERLHAFFSGRTLAAASNVIVTRPLTSDEWAATGMRTTQVLSDTRSLVFYWRRLPDGRLLFGGRGGILESERALARRRAWLEASVARMFPALRDVGSDWFWWGNVCLPYDVTPHVGAVEDDPSVVYALGYTGTGVAMATYCGGLAADLAAGRDVARDTPLTATPLPRFPLPALRRLYLATAYAAYTLKDR